MNELKPMKIKHLNTVREYKFTKEELDEVIRGMRDNVMNMIIAEVEVIDKNGKKRTDKLTLKQIFRV